MSAPTTDDGYFHYAPDPAMPGWSTWELKDPTRFNAVLGPLRVRREGERGGRMRLMPERVHGNLADNIHGGVLMTLADIALFATCRVHDLFEVGTSSTLDLAMQFIAPGRIDRPADAVSEILRETGRLVFLRGLIVQGEEDRIVASYTGTIRKAPR